MACPRSVHFLALPSQVVDEGPPVPFSVTSVSSSLGGTWEDAVCEILPPHTVVRAVIILVSFAYTGLKRDGTKSLMSLEPSFRFHLKLPLLHHRRAKWLQQCE